MMSSELARITPPYGVWGGVRGGSGKLLVIPLILLNMPLIILRHVRRRNIIRGEEERRR